MSAMAVIYAFMGVVFLLLFVDPTGYIRDNILLSFPEDSILNIIVDIFMVITTIGSVPLYISPLSEQVEANFGEDCRIDSFLGEFTSNKYFVTNKKCVIFRVVMVCAISLVGYIFPFFNDVLSFNIL